MADKFRQQNARPTYTPMEIRITLSKAEDGVEPVRVPYQEACRHVLWPAIISRPNMQFAVGILAQFTQNPSEAHWNTLKHVIQYLYTTRDLWLVLGGLEPRVCGYADVDWGSQLNRHSISGYVFFIGSGAMSWSSKKQNLIALLTAEAEYIVAAHAAKDVLWIWSFLQELDSVPMGAIILKCDNQLAIALCKDSKYHACTKHMDIRYHFIQEVVKDGIIIPEYVPTDENPANIFTKSLGRITQEVPIHDWTLGVLLRGSIGI
jgi:hypothetical protein